MAEITMPGMLLTGDHASRPAASAVGGGALYACSTHNLIYQSDTSSWSTWADVSGAGASGVSYDSHRLIATADGVAATMNVNSSTYIDVFSLTFYHDWDFFPATHFAISCVACSNAASQTITAQLAPFGSATNPVSSGGDDLSIPNNGGTTQQLTSGWIAVSDAMSGFTAMCVALKGSNTTVDLSVRMFEIAFKID